MAKELKPAMRKGRAWYSHHVPIVKVDTR